MPRRSRPSPPRCASPATSPDSLVPTARRHDPSERARPAAAVVDRSFLERRRQAVEAEAGRLEPYAEMLQHLESFEAALVELSRREQDPEARRTLEAFRDQRADI